jgi:hypothetical protein
MPNEKEMLLGIVSIVFQVFAKVFKKKMPLTPGTAFEERL